MQYRSDRRGEPISVLGYGCMRFTKKGGRIDRAKAEREILAAIDAGINYFDTAYIYPGSEEALGAILAKNGCRDKVKLATKLPLFLVRSRESFDKLFDEQLRRLQTDRVDYYLMHMLGDLSVWETLKSFGIEDWLRRQQEAGRIGQVGFSYHGDSAMFCRLVDAYDWDFCQIQYNYLDEHSQAGRRGLDYAAARGLPVIIMEPLRGGRLVSQLPPAAKALFAREGGDFTPAGWAFRWLWDQSAVTCVLSGMNSLSMLEENLRTADATPPGAMTEAERGLYDKVRKEIRRSQKVGCTGCGYCMPCPHGVDIPGTFHSWNLLSSESKFAGLKAYAQCTLFRKQASGASACVGCGKCEKHCPQAIPVREKLSEARRDLEIPAYRLFGRAVRCLKLWK